MTGKIRNDETNAFKPGIHSCTYHEALLKVQSLDLQSPAHRPVVIATLCLVFERMFADVSDDLKAVEERAKNAKV